MILLLITIVLGLVMLIAALIAVYNKDMKTAIIAAGLTSLFASVLYVLLAAPDVALTEASIGSGLTTLIFFYVYNKIRRNNAQE